MATIRERRWPAGVPADQQRTAWIADFFDAQGVRRQKTFRLKKDADAWLVQARGQVAAGTFTPESNSVTMKEAIDGWLARAEAEGLERGTQVQYAQHARHILALIDSKAKLTKLTQARCEQVRDDLLKAHQRPTARKILASFKAILRDAKRRGLVAHNVAGETKIERLKRRKRKLKVGRDIPSASEVKTLIVAAGSKAKAMISLAALAGLRAGELRGLRWENIEMNKDDTGVVHVVERADRWNTIGDPKSEEGHRTVPLGEIAVRALRAWRVAQPALITKDEHGNEIRRPRAMVFGTRSDRPDGLGNLTGRVLEPLQLSAGVAVPVVNNDGTPVLEPVLHGGSPVLVDGKPKMCVKMAAKYSWHAFRHYAVSAWLKTCRGDFKKVQTWAGHATLALTLETYGHLLEDPDDHARIADAERALLS
jgi:integrase